jgi:hypothetical protein
MKCALRADRPGELTAVTADREALQYLERKSVEAHIPAFEDTFRTVQPGLLQITGWPQGFPLSLRCGRLCWLAGVLFTQEAG